MTINAPKVCMLSYNLKISRTFHCRVKLYYRRGPHGHMDAAIAISAFIPKRIGTPQICTDKISDFATAIKLISQYLLQERHSATATR